MSLTDRQLLKGYRRAAALRAAGRAASGGAGGAPDVPVHRVDPLHSGIARIVGKLEDGLYQITELWWDGDAEEWIDATAPLGLTQADAVDYTGSTCGIVGQVVRFWEHRALGGEVLRLIDVLGGWGGTFKVSAFTVHYSGTNTTEVFHAVPNCRWAFLEIGLDVRRCSGDTLASDHPAYLEMAYTGGMLGVAWCNALATWSGGDWVNLWYTAHTTSNAVEGVGPDGIYSLNIQCRVTSGGDLEFRIHNPMGSQVSVVIMGAVRLTVCPVPPGTAEIGNCCCHDDDWGTL